MDDEQPLGVVRRQIDALDSRLLELFNRRAALAGQVARLKAEQDAATVYRPEREAELLRRLLAANRGPLGAAALVVLFREVISACRALEARLTVACPVDDDACVAAVRHHFGSFVDVRPLPETQVLETVAAGTADYGLLPEPGDGTVLAPQWLSDRLKVCAAVAWAPRAAARGRWLVFGRQATRPTGCDETALLLPEQSDAAVGLPPPAPLREARCTTAAGRTVRFMVLPGHVRDPSWAAACEMLQARRLEARVLGSFPAPIDVP